MARKTIFLVTGLWRVESGATAIEYGLIAAGMSVVIIAAVALAGGSLNNIFNSIGAGLGAG